MKVAAITRFKHGELYVLLKKLGWSQAELSRRCGFKYQSKVGNMLNLTCRPSLDTIYRLQKAFAEAGEVVDVESMFPNAYVGTGDRIKPVVQIADVPPESIAKLAHHQRMQLESVQLPLPDRVVDSDEALAAFDLVLNETEKVAMRLHFVDGLSITEVATACHRSRMWADVTIGKALRKIRNHLDRMPANNPIKLALTSPGSKL